MRYLLLVFDDSGEPCTVSSVLDAMADELGDKFPVDRDDMIPTDLVDVVWIEKR